MLLPHNILLEKYGDFQLYAIKSKVATNTSVICCFGCFARCMLITCFHLFLTIFDPVQIFCILGLQEGKAWLKWTCKALIRFFIYRLIDGAIKNYQIFFFRCCSLYWINSFNLTPLYQGSCSDVIASVNVFLLTFSSSLIKKGTQKMDLAACSIYLTNESNKLIVHPVNLIHSSWDYTNAFICVKVAL